jgi:hypothetical protein
MSDRQPNKPGGDFTRDGAMRKPGDEQAVENQSTTTPDKYPDDDGGKPDYGSPKRRSDEA